MRVPDLFKEYIWLVNVISKAKKITFAEIQEKWLETGMSEGVELVRSTFNRHKEAIQNIFGIYIDCDRKDGYRYFIDNGQVLEEDTVQNWMLTSLSVSNIVSESLSLQNRILLEQIPSVAYLQQVIDAMKRKVKISMQYRKYGEIEAKIVTLEPYCIKLFRQRWYVLGHFSKGGDECNNESECYRLYSFDRIESMELTKIKFEIKKDFDSKAFFSECMGVIVGDGTAPEKIVLRAYGGERYYIKDLPLHHSQRSKGVGDNYEDFEYYMRPTKDFVSHVMSRANQIKILEPKSLADKVKTLLQESLNLYD